MNQESRIKNYGWGILAAIIILFIAALILAKQAARDWVDVNLLTVSTKAKQEKLLALAIKYPERVDYLRQAEDMAEKIIFLDGKEVEIGYKFERATRGFEIESRIQNRKMFEHLVKNYQFTESDIEKHRAILEEHIKIVEQQKTSVKNAANLKKINDFLLEARKFQKAGLNIEAYEWIDKAKNAL